MTLRDPDFQELDLSPFEEPDHLDESKPDFWQRLNSVAEVVLYVLALLVALKLFWPEVERQRDLNRQLAEIEAVRADKLSQVSALRQEYDLLKNDQEYLETVARDRLNLAREGEYIIRIERDQIVD